VSRIGIDAAGGATRALDLKLRDVHIGDVAQGPFYKGIVFRNGALALYGSDVRAFTHAVKVDGGTVSIAAYPGSTTYEIASLAQLGLQSGQLRDLRGGSLTGTIDNFRALTLGPNVQAFLAHVTVSGPSGISWVNDRLDYTERGLWSIDTKFTNGSDHFENESLMLSAVGRGRLYFFMPTITHVGTELYCPSRPWTPNANLVPEVVFDLPEVHDITYAPQRGLCTFDSPLKWPFEPQVE
jgi:hypothetical protein